MARIVVLCAHPQLEHSRVTRALARAAAGADLPQAAPGKALPQITPGKSLPQVDVRDLYTLYPDYLIDVAAEQAALSGVELLVWLHPVHWYGMTPLLKLWADEVLAFGWAYGPGGTALRGRTHAGHQPTSLGRSPAGTSVTRHAGRSSISGQSG